MEQFGYAWFLDKIDWETMTFRQPYSAYMMFNNPSMQAAYCGRTRDAAEVNVKRLKQLPRTWRRVRASARPSQAKSKQFTITGNAF
jgi:hypothetical protein